MTKPTAQGHQTVLLNKIMLALQLFVDFKIQNKDKVELIPCDVNNIDKASQYLLLDTQAECYKMFINIYLYALVSKKKSDTVSIYNCHTNDKKKAIEEFYKKHDNLIENLRILRNSYYAHFDLNLFQKLKDVPLLSMQEMYECIIDVMNILDYT